MAELPSFIFGGNTGIKTAKDLEARRNRLTMLRRKAIGRTPRNLGEGIDSLGAALATRFGRNRLNKEVSKGEEELLKELQGQLPHMFGEPVISEEGAFGNSIEGEPFDGVPPGNGGRPVLSNPDGTFSTEETITSNVDGQWVNIPTIINGQRVSEEQAVAAHRAGQNPGVGSFGTLPEAEAAARQRSDQIGVARGPQPGGPLFGGAPVHSAPTGGGTPPGMSAPLPATPGPVAPGGAAPGGPSLPALIKIFNSPFVSDGQKAILGPVIQRMATPVDPREQEAHDLRMALGQKTLNAPATPIQAADGYWYDPVTQQRVLPGVRKPVARRKRDTVLDVNGRRRYLDTGEFAFPDVEKEVSEADQLALEERRLNIESLRKKNAERPRVKDVNGVEYYADTGEPVLENNVPFVDPVAARTAEVKLAQAELDFEQAKAGDPVAKQRAQIELDQARLDFEQAQAGAGIKAETAKIARDQAAVNLDKSKQPDEQIKKLADGRLYYVGGPRNGQLVNPNVTPKPDTGTAGGFGSLEPGTRLVTDPVTKEVRVEEIPGGKVEREREAAAVKKANLANTELMKNDLVFEDIERAIQMTKEGDFWGVPTATGLVGQISEGIGGTPAHALSEILVGVKANIAFDRLNQMRQNSPTGGALGNVSNFEVKSLGAVMSSLAVSQRQEDLQFNLRRLKKLYKVIITKGLVDPNDPSTQGQGRVTLDEAVAGTANPAGELNYNLETREFE